MSSLAIVAIPERDDRVWKLSSQKVPHMTLLFLGEDSTLSSDAVKYVEHVVSTMRRFFMDVDRRGVLGDDKADVLFFDKYNVDWLENIRSYLLSNTEIAKLYNTSKQFDSWTPHLTLGFPDAPAKEDLDYGIYSVGFDRVAVWTGDFEGPEFVLPKEEDIPVAMRDSVEEALAHYGVKGMRWGVRKRSGGGGKSGKTKFSKPPNKLSDAELNRRISRLEREDRYNKLNAEKKSKGREFAEGIIESSGRSAAKKVATGAALVTVSAVLQRSGSRFAQELLKRLG